MRKYWGVFQNYFASAIEYRSNLLGIILLEITALGLVVVLWFSVYQAGNTIGGFSFNKTLNYYLLIPLIGFITQVKLSDNLGWEIKDGDLSNYLLKPYDISAFSFMRVLGGKIQTLLTILPFYFVILFLYANFAAIDLFSLSGVMAATTIALSAFILHFFLDLTITWLAFWVDDVWAFDHIKQIAFGVLGGFSFPLEFLPGSLRAVFEFLPFQYFYYVPLDYLIGERPLSRFFPDVLQICLWSGLLVLLGWLLWQRGLSKYEAHGS